MRVQTLQLTHANPNANANTRRPLQPGRRQLGLCVRPHRGRRELYAGRQLQQDQGLALLTQHPLHSRSPWWRCACLLVRSLALSLLRSSHIALSLSLAHSSVRSQPALQHKERSRQASEGKEHFATRKLVSSWRRAQQLQSSIWRRMFACSLACLDERGEGGSRRRLLVCVCVCSCVVWRLEANLRGVDRSAARVDPGREVRDEQHRCYLGY